MRERFPFGHFCGVVTVIDGAVPRTTKAAHQHRAEHAAAALLAQNDAAIKRTDASIEQSRSLIAQAEAQVKWTSDDFERAQKLGGGVISVSTIEQRETALKIAQAQFAAANNALSVAEADRKSRDAERQELQVRIARTEVKAPVSGLVSRRSAKLGATACRPD